MISAPLFAQQADSTQSKPEKKKTVVANPVYYATIFALSRNIKNYVLFQVVKEL